MSDVLVTLAEVAKAAGRWLAVEPLEQLLRDLRREEGDAPKIAQVRVTDRHRRRAYETLRSKGRFER